MSLRKKLIFSFILCLLLPATIILVVSNQLTKGMIKDKAVEDGMSTLEVMEQYIHNTIEKMLYVSNYIQFDNDINAIIKQRWSRGDIVSQEQFVEDFLNAKKVTEKLENISFPGEKTYITILLPDGTNYTNYAYTEYDPRRFFDEPWFQDLVNQPSFSTYWIQTHPSYLQSDQESQEQMITIAKTIKYFSSEPFAYLIVSLNENQISDIFAGQDTNRETVLLDSSGVIVSHQDNAKIGETFAYFDDFRSGSDSHLIEIEEEDYLLLKRELRFSDWTIVNMIPYKEAVSRINTIQKVNLTIQVLFFSLFLVILITLVRRFTKPIFRLGRVAAQVQDGNLQVRSHVRGKDEIGRLGRSFDEMLDRIEHMFTLIQYEQSRKRKAELEMLQAQINPHFLFNILNSIRMRILLNGDKDNAALISSLSALLRMTINRNNEFIPLHEEVETVTHYVSLMNSRHKGSIHLHVELAADTLMEEVPRFFMQPIIENSLIHGLRDQEGTIWIKSQKEDGDLAIEIGDTGEGMDEEHVARLRARIASLDETSEEDRFGQFSGIGLNNVYERIRLIYGDTFAFTIDSEPQIGTTVRIRIPLRRESADV